MNVQLHNQETKLEAHEGFIIEGDQMGNGIPVEVRAMSLNKIKLGRNSRRAIKDDEIAGLMASIKEQGILQPIGVTPAKNGGFEIVYGNRRFLACSKLGLKKIPVIIHQDNSAKNIDIKNLTENLQRRNISISEAGRYMELLEQEGLTSREIAARLGLSKTYIQTCLDAFRKVPEKYREDLEIKSKHGSTSPGKIAVSTAQKIIDMARREKLSKPQTEQIFEAAKKTTGFSAENIGKYALAVKGGDKDFVKNTEKLVHVSIQFFMSETEFDKLTSKYVTDGPFRSVPALCKAILKGEKSHHIKMAKG